MPKLVPKLVVRSMTEINSKFPNIFQIQGKVWEIVYIYMYTCFKGDKRGGGYSDTFKGSLNTLVDTCHIYW